MTPSLHDHRSMCMEGKLVAGASSFVEVGPVPFL